MAQPGFCLNFGKSAIEGRKFEMMNLGLTKGENSKDSVNSTSKDKFQCTYFRSRFSKTPEKKNSIPCLDRTAASDISDPYSDSDSEADNRKNVARWLESLPTNQDWCDIEDDLPNRQGDFSKGTISNIEILKNTTQERIDESQPSTSFKNDTTISRNQKTPKNKLSKTKDPKYKNSAEKLKFRKLKVHFKETPTEIRSENSKYSKLLVSSNWQFKNNCESFEKPKNQNSMQISNSESKDLSTSDESNEEKGEIRKSPYNLRNLDSRRVEKNIEARTSDSERKTGRSRRSCSIRNQEYKKKSRGVSSANNQAKKHEVFSQVEDLKPARKLKSPFTKQASSSKTPALFTGTPYTSSYKLNELEEAKQNVQKLDRGTGRPKHVDRKRIVKSKLAKNKKLLKAVKDLVNVIDSNTDQVENTHFCRKIHSSQNEGTENSGLAKSFRSNETHMRTLESMSKKLPFVNLKLEKKLDQSMEIALKKYKRTHGIWEVIENKKICHQSDEPPMKKKKRPVF